MATATGREEDTHWGTRPNKFVVDILKNRKSGRVLDLGVGEGRNALFLAKNGFTVTGVDQSRDNLEAFLANARRMSLSVEGILDDIRRFDFKHEFDIIASTATLHFLSREEAVKLIGRMKQHTVQGGLNIVTVFTEDNPVRFPYLFRRGELRGLYHDWNILEYDEYVTDIERHWDGEPHRHAVAAMMAERRTA